MNSVEKTENIVSLIDKILNEHYENVFGLVYQLAAIKPASEEALLIRGFADLLYEKTDELYRKEKLVIFPCFLKQCFNLADKDFQKVVSYFVDRTKTISKSVQYLAMIEVFENGDVAGDLKGLLEQIKTSWLKLVKSKELLFVEIGIDFPGEFSLW